MNVGIFTDAYPPYISGVCTSVLMLKKALEQKGHDVFVVTINKKSMNYEFEDGGKILRVPGLPVGLYDLRQSSIYPLRAVRHVKKWNLDLIHSHTEFSIGAFARILSRRLGIPLVHTYHTMYEEYLHYVTRGHFNSLGKKVVEYLTLFLCDRTIDELVVVSQKAYDLFKTRYKVDRDIHIIPTKVDVERFHSKRISADEVAALRRNLGLSLDDFILLYVGRIAPEKNLDLLIEAQKSLAGGERSIKLLLVGYGPDLESVQARVSAPAFKGSVILAGKVEWTEIPKYYHLADIFVTASKSETQGLTVEEALGASVPVVCIEDGSFMGTVIPGMNGYMFRTEEQYREIIHQLHDDRNKLDSLRKQTQACSESHSLSGYAERMLHVYAAALEVRRTRNNSTLWGRIRKAYLQAR